MDEDRLVGKYRGGSRSIVFEGKAFSKFGGRFKDGQRIQGRRFTRNGKIEKVEYKEDVLVLREAPTPPVVVSSWEKEASDVAAQPAVGWAPSLLEPTASDVVDKPPEEETAPDGAEEETAEVAEEETAPEVLAEEETAPEVAEEETADVAEKGKAKRARAAT